MPTVKAGTEELYISTLYQLYLGRTPEASGLKLWVDYLKKYGPGVVSQALERSPERRTRAFKGFYLNYLGREGSDVEIKAWVDNGVAISVCSAYFLSSQEYLDSLDTRPQPPTPDPEPIPPPPPITTPAPFLPPAMLAGMADLPLPEVPPPT